MNGKILTDIPITHTHTEPGFQSLFIVEDLMMHDYCVLIQVYPLMVSPGQSEKLTTQDKGEVVRGGSGFWVVGC